MDDFWNKSDTTPATLDNFFDEESNINWTGSSKHDTSQSVYYSSSSQSILDPLGSSSLSPQSPTNPEQHKSKSHHKSSHSSGSLSSILDNISIHSDSALAGISGQKAKVVGKALGEKIEGWKPPSVSIKWKSEGSSAGCVDCRTKDEEILQLRRRLERAASRQLSLHALVPPSEAIRKALLTGPPLALESYKALEDKVALLEVALDAGDGSTVLEVVVFMRRTVKRSRFWAELQKRPLAAQLYVNYLKQRQENTEALEVLGFLGRTEEAALLSYELSLVGPWSGVGGRLARLSEVARGSLFAGEDSLSFEAKALSQQIQLLELQLPLDARDSAPGPPNPMLSEHPRATCVSGQPVLTTLFYCSMYHWGSKEGATEAPLAIKRAFGVPDRQFLWTVIRARAKVRHWPLPEEVDKVGAPKGLLGSFSSSLTGLIGGGKSVKNSLPVERVVETLAGTGAPANVLFAYINLLGSNEAKLRLGLAHKCHLAVVEAYVGLKDKESLEAYLRHITFGSPEYIKAENALKNLK